MNMMSVLIGATGILLIAAVALSFGSMSRANGSEASQAELVELRAEIERLNAAEAELQLLQQQQFLSGNQAMGLTTPGPGSAAVLEEAERIAQLTAENAALKDENVALKGEVEVSEQKADVYRDEAGLIAQREMERHHQEQRRARVIREALLIARVTEWSENDGFAVITIERPENVQEGAVLAIRRNSGVIGQVQVSGIYESGQAVVDPVDATFLGGSIDIQPGDELIIPPL
jgi:hypothetical protein